MSVFPIGGDRIGIVTPRPVLDGDGNPVVSEFMEPVTDGEDIAWVDGCLFEVQPPGTRPGMREVQADTTTTSEVAEAWLPVVNGEVPVAFGPPMPVSAITSSLKLRHDGRDYVMRGDAVLEKDIRGREHHVSCLCEHEAG